jgi:hypothetical protein
MAYKLVGPSFFFIGDFSMAKFIEAKRAKEESEFSMLVDLEMVYMVLQRNDGGQQTVRIYFRGAEAQELSGSVAEDFVKQFRAYVKIKAGKKRAPPPSLPLRT